jgi:hypothetical protein
MENYSTRGQTVRNENGRWFVEDDTTRQVRFVSTGDFQTGYAECVSWLQWFREGLDR